MTDSVCIVCREDRLRQSDIERWNNVNLFAEKNDISAKSSTFKVLGSLHKVMSKALSKQRVFHTTCYSRFTALPNDGKASKVTSQESRQTPLLRSETVTHASTSSGVISSWCIVRKK